MGGSLDLSMQSTKAAAFEITDSIGMGLASGSGGSASGSMDGSSGGSAGGFSGGFAGGSGNASLSGKIYFINKF